MGVFMILLNGVTGFNYVNDKSPPTVDRRQFKNISFIAITKNGGNILSFDEPNVGRNFYKVKVKVFGEHMYILLNISYPFLAFATLIEFGNIKFVDNHLLNREFSPFYRVLNASELNEPLLVRDVKGKIIVENDNELNDAEVHQITYWKPVRTGDVIFNYWD